MMEDDLIALYPEGEIDSQALYDKVWNIGFHFRRVLKLNFPTDRRTNQ